MSSGSASLRALVRWGACSSSEARTLSRNQVHHDLVWRSCCRVRPSRLGGFVLSRACYAMTTFGPLVFDIEFVHSRSLVDEVG